MFKTFNTDLSEKVVIGSRTIEEAAFQVCNFMELLYKCIHFSDGKEIFSTGNCMKIDVVYHNINTYFDFIESKVEKKETYKRYNYRNYIDAINQNLIHLYSDDKNLDSVKMICDRLLYDAFDDLQKTYPSLKFKK